MLGLTRRLRFGRDRRQDLLETYDTCVTETRILSARTVLITFDRYQ